MNCKKIISVLSLIFVLNSSQVFATSNIVEKHIPKYMDSGTTITFDKNKNVVTLNKGEKTKFSKNNSANIKNSDLPLAKEGMKVTYDALGQPIVLNEDARKQSGIIVDVKKISTASSTINGSNISSPMAVTHSQTGYTSYYYAAGHKGQSGVTLDQFSAAHMTLPYWTTVHVYNVPATKSAVVYVLDRGHFSAPVIIDIDSTRFATFYSLSKGLFNSKIEWYTS